MHERQFAVMSSLHCLYILKSFCALSLPSLFLIVDLTSPIDESTLSNDSELAGFVSSFEKNLQKP